MFTGERPLIRHEVPAMAIKLKTPSMSMLQTFLWVTVIGALLRFALTRFGGSVGGRIVSYL